ncbi:MAG: Terpene synthase metal-binding protein [Collimonas fungivorans]|uniref:terpene synthase family protein n=1 Tax=Collimonas fungivorans TaxID=158899 RepID=UPI0026F2F22D|nr:hypothetical protein [Collimonas fungivorans]MDB5767682.1 Terpene synthase metal-binding protein [Collimonas fungivorans]
MNIPENISLAAANTAGNAEMPAYSPMQASGEQVRARLLSELESISIPDFEFPWPCACSPDAESVEKETNAWAAAHKLLPDERYRARVARTKYGWLAARCYPRAGRALLQTIADYFTWYFLADDLFVDRVELVTPDTVPNLTAMIDVLDFNCLGPDPLYGESAWLDVCRRLRRQLSAEHFQRFANGMRMWASTAGLQILNHTHSTPLSLRQYQTVRRHTSGMNPCLDLVDVANDGPLSAAEYNLPAIQQLRRHTNNVVCWSNDIQSLAVELRQPGQHWNMVGIYAAQGHSLQESVDYTVMKVRTEINGFADLAGAMEIHAGPALRGAIAGMKNWMRGYQDWVESDTKRYSEEFAGQDADDRGMLAPRN